MKKWLVLVLALVLVFGLSVPAMAFTSDTSEDEDHPYDLDIYLVEYEDNDLFGFATLPPSDRGYAKNEIVAAVVELVVPEDEKIDEDEYGTLVFGGENVDLDVSDNYDGGDIVLLTTDNVIDTPTLHANVDMADELVDDEIYIEVINLEGDETYKWLFFAKVTDDDASLYAKLVDGIGNTEFITEEDIEENDLDIDLPEWADAVLAVTLDGTEYLIYTAPDTDDPDGKDRAYVVLWDDDGETKAFAIITDEDHKSIGMQIGVYDDDLDLMLYYDLGVNTKNELGVLDPSNPAKFMDTDDELYEDIMDIYNDVIVDVFGLDYFKIGNYVRDSFFEDLVSGDTIVATVDIEPWTAYVTVPDNIVVDPPKTGDAASIMGFVMVALSGAGIVALRKRG